jgi:hypothetical protein
MVNLSHSSTRSSVGFTGSRSRRCQDHAYQVCKRATDIIKHICLNAPISAYRCSLVLDAMRTRSRRHERLQMYVMEGIYHNSSCNEPRLEDEVEYGADYLTRRAMCFEFCVLLAWCTAPTKRADNHKTLVDIP